MVWDHLSINRPHLVYIILGGFTSIFMLCSLFIKEKLYIGEATVATICGIIFGPSGANLINPLDWGNPDQITLEFSRIVLVVQCFAIGVELPKSYMERHWRSVVFLLVPVMTWGWLVTSLFIWWMIEPLTWLESLICAACVTATDPVLASSVVGKGKFAKRIPKHLRDILSAESGCNDGMAFPFVYLSLYLARYRPHADKVAFHWICYTILYECIFGAIYGVVVGYCARHAIKWAEKKGLIDRESFLVFYFVLALFCAGSGSFLGMDDLLVGFCAGVGFSNDGWFTEKTEESHVSNVIDLLLNLSYFVYFGTVIPWGQFNSPDHGMIPWRLVVLGIMVLLFRRIPIMLMLKPVIPDIKTWREALFAGHFGPIGVGAIFVAILARAELETESTDPLAELPPPGSKDWDVIYLIWPITCFMVILSIAIHGSSIAVFTLGKRINTLTISLSYTQEAEMGGSWMDRIPRLSSTGSKANSQLETTSLGSESNEKLPFPPGTLGPTGVRGNFLRRQKDDSENSGTAPVSRSRGKKKTKDGQRPGGPVSQSAIKPQWRSEMVEKGLSEETAETKSEDVSAESPTSLDMEKRVSSSSSSADRDSHDKEKQHARADADVEVYDEGEHMVIEDEEGNVLSTADVRDKSPEQVSRKVEKERENLAHDESGEHAKHKLESHPKEEGEELAQAAAKAAGQPYKNLKKQFGNWKGWGKSGDSGADESKTKAPERKRGAAHAYHVGNTIIVEDEDGEVLQTYTIPAHDKTHSTDNPEHAWRKMSNTADFKRGLGRMGTWVGRGGEKAMLTDEQMLAALSPQKGPQTPGIPAEGSVDRHQESNDFFADNNLRFTISHIDRHGHGLSGTSGTNQAFGITTKTGRRYSTVDFVKELQQLDPKSQIKAIDDSSAPEHVKTEMKRVAREDKDRGDTTQKNGERSGRSRGNSMPSSKPSFANNNDSSESSNSQSQSPALKPSIRRAETDIRQPPRSTDEESKSSTWRRPSPARLDTTPATIEEQVEPEPEDIPTYDVSATLSKFRRDGGTAADSRRQRLAPIDSSEEKAFSDPTPTSSPQASRAPRLDSEGGEGETSVEQHRRLAALGQVDTDESDSDTEDDETGGPSSARLPVRKREEMAPEPKTKIQWGGEKGREEATAATEGGAESATAVPANATGAEEGVKNRKGIRSLFGNKKR